MKIKKLIIGLLVIATIGLATSIFFIVDQKSMVEAASNTVKSEKNTYIKRKYECSGDANTTNSIVNTANLTDCGGRMAVESLKFKSLYDIYHTYCRMGFGVVVYGCALPAINTVYVCTPGTSLYDWRNTYVSYYFIRYQYISYSCDLDESKNTIRHELLHLIYNDMKSEERARVNDLLAPYRWQYTSELSPYPSYKQDGELFVRVGADGVPVNDIELIEAYSKVSKAYTAQKQKYYGDLIAMTDKYINNYKALSDQYNVMLYVVIAVVAINVILLICLIISKVRSNKRGENSAKGGKERPQSVLDMHKKSKKALDADEELEELRRKIDMMGNDTKKSKVKEFEEYKIKELGKKSNTSSKKTKAEEFEDFKKKYGIIDLD